MDRPRRAVPALLGVLALTTPTVLGASAAIAVGRAEPRAAGLAAVVAQDSDEPIPGVEEFKGLDPAHRMGPIAYEQTPPVGGEHSPIWVNCGAYAQVVPTEMAVHSLEHGAVWVTYRPDLADADVAALRALARGQDFVLVSPWGAGRLPSAVVAVAWGLRLQTDDAADSRLAAFVARYANGPQTPEPGAPCGGGLGTPLPNP